MIQQVSKRYDAYRDSEIEWLGEIPKHWELKRLKEVVTGGLSYGANESAVDSNPLHPRYIRITDFSDDETLREETFKSLTPDIAKNYLLKEGDILLARSGATAGKTFHFKNYSGQACYAGYLIKARPKQSILLSDFISYFTKSHAYNNWRNSVVIKATIENISAEKYGFFLLIPRPSLSEQQAITAYLDDKTAQIDQQIDLLSQKAKHYSELKQALINETVTRGLDKTVPMKESGIEWIGEIPAHWRIERIKETSVINRKSLSEKTPDDYKFEYVDISGVTFGQRGYLTESLIFSEAPSRARRIVKKGDTLISTVRTYLKAVANIESDVKDLIASTGFAVITPKNKVYEKYQSYLLTADFIIDEICALSTGVSYPAINASTIGNLFFLLPPYTEQKAIADYLDQKASQIDAIVETINAQIDNLKALRKTLINDVVTGKICIL
ncbi:restriction endonuclease subunit S [Methylomonas koyamae]|uniref:restriction endonuclease subunit S n=1 Tax=Methylomonas koyamae TaxID=702114 RepID=UPI000AD487E1|nr:restriction endonuclease subunit S [Methylomonas koyamae]BBL58877.1 type I restriction-modification protein subunit S [Methylomonas koyamae]